MVLPAQPHRHTELHAGAGGDGLSIAREREAGTFDQLLVSPATPTEIALAKLIPGCVVGLAHGTIFLLVSVFGFGVPFTGSVVLLYVAIFIFSLAAGGIGLMISSCPPPSSRPFWAPSPWACPASCFPGP